MYDEDIDLIPGNKVEKRLVFKNCLDNFSRTCDDIFKIREEQKQREEGEEEE